MRKRTLGKVSSSSFLKKKVTARPYVKYKKRTDVKNEENILYLLILEINGTEVYKIGVTGRSVEDRVSEILLSFYTKYRYFPYCKPKRFRKIPNAYRTEADLLDYFKEYKYNSKYKFSGSTELISGIDLDRVLDKYHCFSNTPRKEESKNGI